MVEPTVVVQSDVDLVETVRVLTEDVSDQAWRQDQIISVKITRGDLNIEITATPEEAMDSSDDDHETSWTNQLIGAVEKIACAAIVGTVICLIFGVHLHLSSFS